jgi:tyrosinase
MSNNFTIRKNIHNFSVDELKNVRTAYGKMMTLPKNDNRSFHYYAGIHDFPGGFCWHDPRPYDGYPDVNLFLPWHRAYLYRFEKALQDQVPSVTIPYWDWRSETSADQGIPKAFSEQTDDDKKPNPFYKSHISFPESGTDRDTERFPGTIQGLALPTHKDVYGVINDSTDPFFDFSERLREIHNNVHGWTGGIGVWNDGTYSNGDMSVTTFAAFDPIFWSHHCMIDKLWWMWQQKNGVENIPNEWKDMVLEPFEMKVKDVLNIYQLGYDYGIDGSAVDGNWSGPLD